MAGMVACGPGGPGCGAALGSVSGAGASWLDSKYKISETIGGLTADGVDAIMAGTGEIIVEGQRQIESAILPYLPNLRDFGKEPSMSTALLPFRMSF